GIDMSSSEPVEAAIDTYDEMVDEFASGRRPSAPAEKEGCYTIKPQIPSTKILLNSKLQAPNNK
ncbi:MAG: hypothetical protein R6V04_09025, partial [bacterium]